MTDIHLEKHSSKHLARHSSNHLKLRHPGYTTEFVSSPGYSGYVEGEETIPYDENFDGTLFGLLAQRVNSAILAMTSGSTAKSLVCAGHAPRGGNYYNVWGSAQSKGQIYRVTANGGAPFGSPLCDLTVTFSSYQYGISGTPFLRIGTGPSAPTGDPRNWAGTQITASSVLTDFSIGTYVWLMGWFSGAISVSYGAPQIEVSGTLAFGTVRHQTS